MGHQVDETILSSLIPQETKIALKNQVKSQRIVSRIVMLKPGGLFGAHFVNAGGISNVLQKHGESSEN